MMRFLVAILALGYLFVLCCASGAEFMYRRGMAARDVSLVRKAQKLNPLSSQYRYGEYVLTQDIGALVRAIRLEPGKPAYHVYYGLALLRQSVRTRSSDQIAVREICRGADLKPYSKAYREVCDEYRSAIPG